MNRQNDRFLAIASHAAGMAAFAWNTSTGKTTWGADAKRVLGFEPDADTGPSLRDLLDAADLACFDHCVIESRETGTRFWYPARLRRADQAYYWTEVRGAFGERGTPEESVMHGFITDVHEQKLRDLQAREVLERYRAVLDSLPDRVWAKGLDGKTNFVNRTYTESPVLALSPPLGKTNVEVLPAHMHANVLEDDAGILKTGKPKHLEVIILCNGEERHFDVLKSPLRDAQGNIIGITGLTHDVTERKMLERSLAATLREHESVIDTCPTSICITLGGKIARCNPAAAALLGYAVDELVGQSTWIFFKNDQQTRATLHLLYESERDPPYLFQRETELTRKDGSKVWVFVSTSVMDRAARHAVSTWVDITEQKKAARAQIEAREAADAANRAKSAFLAHMSHEIRTPMHGVLGMLELLDGTNLDATQRDTLRVAHDSARALLGLLDGVLDFSKIESGEVEIHSSPFDLPGLCKQCLALFREAATQKGIELKGDFDGRLATWLNGDSLRLRQIISNLLSNAIKFTGRGGVVFTVHVLENTDATQRLNICVADTGIGIQAAQQQRLFKPFTQADAGTTRRFGGTGLGLSISKRLAEAMGGELTLQSTPGVGTEVTLQLSLAVCDPLQATPADPNQRLAPSNALTGARVLVAEDHPVSLRLMARQLESLGYQADLAVNGEDALRMWQAGNYALIITDCHMPEMDGFELAQKIRRFEINGRRVPILACTASGMSDETRQCLAAGMNDVMVKPVTMATLRATLKHWVSEHPGTQ